MERVICFCKLIHFSKEKSISNSILLQQMRSICCLCSARTRKFEVLPVLMKKPLTFGKNKIENSIMLKTFFFLFFSHILLFIFICVGSVYRFDSKDKDFVKFPSALVINMSNLLVILHFLRISKVRLCVILAEFGDFSCKIHKKKKKT